MELIFSIVMNFHVQSLENDFLGIFQEFFRTAFSKNTTDRMLLVLSDYLLKIPRTPFNPLTPGGNKNSYILQQTFN